MEKKVVRYRVGEYPTSVRVGEGTWLYPLDHTDTLNVSNRMLARTSRVVAFDEVTGRIETLNSIYLPEEN